MPVSRQVANPAAMPGADPVRSVTGYWRFVGFTVKTSLLVLFVISVVWTATVVLGMADERGNMVNGFFIVLASGAVFLVPVLAVSLTLGYAVFRVVLGLGGGVLTAAAAAAAIGSMGLAVTSSVITRSILPASASPPMWFLQSMWVSLKIYLFAGPVSVGVAWRHYRHG